MSNVEIEIFKIAQTSVDRSEVQRWLSHIGVSDDFQIPISVTDPALLVALAAKRCYKSFEVGLNPNVTRIRQEYGAYLDNVLASAHGSVLEHSVYSFAIEGLSRICTEELNRHRVGWAVSEESLRYIRFGDDIPWWMPITLRPQEDDNAELSNRKSKTRRAFVEAFETQRRIYNELVSLWRLDEMGFGEKKKLTSCFRRIIGMGVATGGVWTGNIRALRHVITMRASEGAEEEIAYVFSRIARMMLEGEGMLFGDFQEDDQGNWHPRYIKV